MVLEPADDTIFASLRDGSSGVAGDIELAGEDTSECTAGGVGRWVRSVGAG